MTCLAVSIDGHGLVSGSADKTIKLIGGGAKSAIWPQMLADVTGYEFALLNREDVALWGAAMLAAAGTGDITDVRSVAKEHVGIKSVCKPNEANTKAYAPYISTYENFTLQMHDLYKQLNRL